MIRDDHAWLYVTPATIMIVINYDTGFILLVGNMDFIPGPFNVNFTAGGISVPFYVALLDDDMLEGDENFYLIINPSSLPIFGTVNDTDQAIVTIVDDDGEYSRQK